jgi:hypothetical protein
MMADNELIHGFHSVFGEVLAQNIFIRVFVHRFEAGLVRG